jgi:hypothetical protein
MALFTSKADHDLPLLTQLYQTDVSELREFAALYRGFNEWRIDHSPEFARFLELLADLRGVTRNVLDDLADTGKVRWIRLPELAHWVNFIRPLYRMTAMPDRAGYVTPEDIEIVQEDAIAQEDRFLFDVVSNLLAVSRESGRVRRCAMCGNSYAMQKVRDENRYCSARCSARVRMQRKREKHNEANVTAKVKALAVTP